MSKRPSEKRLVYKEATSRLGRGWGDAALINAWRKMAVEEADRKGRQRRTAGSKDGGKGTPKGGAILPLLANLHVPRFLRGWKQQGWVRKQQAGTVNQCRQTTLLPNESPPARKLMKPNSPSLHQDNRDDSLRLPSSCQVACSCTASSSL